MKTKDQVKIDIARSRLPLQATWNLLGTPYREALREMVSQRGNKTELAVWLLDNDPNIRLAAKILMEEMSNVIDK